MSLNLFVALQGNQLDKLSLVVEQLGFTESGPIRIVQSWSNVKSSTLGTYVFAADYHGSWTRLFGRHQVLEGFIANSTHGQRIAEQLGTQVFAIASDDTTGWYAYRLWTPNSERIVDILGDQANESGLLENRQI